jgi:WD40 repeat protein
MKPSVTISAAHIAPQRLRTRWLLSLCAALVALAALSPAVAQEQAPLPKHAKAKIGSDRWGAAIRATTFGPDDAVAVTYDNGYVRRWDLSTQHLVWEARLGTQPLTVVTFAGAKTLAVAAADGTTTLLNAANGAVTKTFKLDLCHKACELKEIHATDKVLLTLGVIQNTDDGTSQGTLRLWSLSDGKLLQTHVATNASTASISTDGAHIAWTAFDQPVAAYLVSAAAMSPPKPLTCPVFTNDGENQGELLLFTPNSQALALVGTHNTTYTLITCLWATDKATPLHTIDIPSPHYLQILRAIASSDDGKWLQISYDEGYMEFGDFDLEASQVIAVDLTEGKATSLRGYEPAQDATWTYNRGSSPFSVYGEAFPITARSQGTKLTLTERREKWGTTIDLPPKWLTAHAHTGAIQQLAASPDGAEVISVDRFNLALRWRVGGGDSPARTFQAQGQLLYTPDGLSLLEAHPAIQGDRACSADPRMGSLGLWNLTTMTRATLRRDPKLMTRAARWLPDGRLLTCREARDANESDCDHPGGPVHSYFEALSSDGQVVKPFKADFTLCPTATGISPATSRAITFYNMDLESGSRPFIGSDVRVQDLIKGDILFDLPEGASSDAALSPDGKWVAYISDEDEALSVLIFSVDAKAEVSSTPLTETHVPDHGVPVAFFSPDNRLIYGDGATLRVADPALGADAFAKALTVSGHTASISAATFSADGKTLFTAQYDGLIFAWDWPSIIAP